MALRGIVKGCDSYSQVQVSRITNKSGISCSHKLTNSHRTFSSSWVTEDCRKSHNCRRSVAFQLSSLPAKQPFPDPSAVPWQFGFQCNERYLKWEDAAQEQLVKIYLAQKLDITPEEVDERMEALANILPDMVGRLQRTRADLLLRMMSDMQGLVGKLMGLKALLPKCNVSLMVSRYPYILLEYSVDDVEKTLDDMRSKLPGVDVEDLLEREPLLLRANIEQILADIRRLLPSGDPVALLVSNPQMVLDMQTGNMPSSEDMLTA